MFGEANVIGTEQISRLVNLKRILVGSFDYCPIEAKLASFSTLFVSGIEPVGSAMILSFWKVATKTGNLP